MTKTSLLIVLAVALIATVHSHQENDPWECKHDHVVHPEISFTDIEEAGLNEVKSGQGRRLGSSQFRTYGYYGLIGSGSYKNYLENELVPPVLAYFEAALSTNYPVSGSLKVTTGSLCGYATPSVLKSGVQADYVYMIMTENAGDQWVMNSSPCSLASGSNRPLVGLTRINPAYILATSDPVLHEKNMICLMHEMTHTLGFSSTLFKHFIDESGAVLTGTYDGSSNEIINVSPLTSMLRSYFGCSSLKGAYMENYGSGATAGSHFERKQYAYEAMTSGLTDNMQYSKFSLAMLESSGWYTADYSYADPYFWGQGNGCSFLTNSCSASAFPDEWCTGSGRACTSTGRSGGSCSTDSKTDGCRFVHPSEDYDCDSTSAEPYARLPGIQTFGRGEGSKCFEGTLNSKSAGSQTTFCFKYSCSGSGSDVVLNIEVGTTTVECTSKGSKTVSGYGGVVDCPDPVQWCSTVGAKTCPRGCMGRGNCASGKCACYNGFTGEDCALNA